MVDDSESDDGNPGGRVAESYPGEIIGPLVRLAKPSFPAALLRRLAENYFRRHSEERYLADDEELE